MFIYAGIDILLIHPGLRFLPTTLLLWKHHYIQLFPLSLSSSLSLTAYLFQIIALSIGAVWMYNLIFATVRLTIPKEPAPPTWLHSFLSVLPAFALGGLALLPPIISVSLKGTGERE